MSIVQVLVKLLHTHTHTHTHTSVVNTVTDKLLLCPLGLYNYDIYIFKNFHFGSSPPQRGLP